VDRDDREVVSMAKLERKVGRIEIKAEAAKGGIVAGWPTTFEPPERHDWYGDIIDRHALDKTIAAKGPDSDDPSIVMLWEHGSPFGVPTLMTLSDDGMYAEGRPSDTTENKDRLVYIADRVIRGLSIGFRTISAEEVDYETPWGSPVRRITELDLIEYSPVYSPANPFAQIDPSKSYDWKRSDDGMWLPTGEKSPRTVVAVKAGKVLSAKNLALVESAIDALTALRDAATTEDDKSGSAYPILEQILADARRLRMADDAQ